MIVDGYNVIYAWHMDISNLEDARSSLLHILDDFAGFSEEAITVVFDGYNTKAALSEEKHGLLTVIYTAYGITADTYIQRIAKTSQKRLKVVTADYLEQLSVFSSGAIRVTPYELKLLIKATREKHVALLHKTALSNSEIQKRLRLDAISDK